MKQVGKDVWAPIYFSVEFILTKDVVVAQISDAQRVLDGMRRIVQALRVSSRQAERRVGLSGAQLFVLQRLVEGDGISVGDLARRTHTHQSSVSVVVSRLVEAGLVERSKSEVDGRAVVLIVTEEGRTALKGAPQLAQGQLIAALHKLSPARRRELADGMEAWVRAAGLDEGEAAMFFEAKRGQQAAGKRKTT